MLNGYLEVGGGIGACSINSTHQPHISVLLGTVHMELECYSGDKEFSMGYLSGPNVITRVLKSRERK